MRMEPRPSTCCSCLWCGFASLCLSRSIPSFSCSLHVLDPLVVFVYDRVVLHVHAIRRWWWVVVHHGTWKEWNRNQTWWGRVSSFVSPGPSPCAFVVKRVVGVWVRWLWFLVFFVDGDVGSNRVGGPPPPLQGNLNEGNAIHPSL